MKRIANIKVKILKHIAKRIDHKIDIAHNKIADMRAIVEDIDELVGTLEGN